MAPEWTPSGHEVVPDVVTSTAMAVAPDTLAALASLPRVSALSWSCRFYEDLTEAQSVEALGISVGTVKSQASRALSALRSPRSSRSRPGEHQLRASSRASSPSRPTASPTRSP